MGTRADFYVRKDNQMEWLGSKAWDGYPDGIDEAVLKSETETDFRGNLSKFFSDNDDISTPENGWPWPWKDSRTTDYSYIFENGKVMASNYGYPLFDPMAAEEENEEGDDEQKMENYFPDMTLVQSVQFGSKKGGIIIVKAGSNGEREIL